MTRFQLIRSLVLAFVLSFVWTQNVCAQNSIEDLDLDDLSETDCIFLDSCIRADDGISDDQKIEYYVSMEWAYEQRSNYFLALYCIDSLISLYERNSMTELLADTYRDKSMLHDYVGQYPRAMEASQKALEIYVEIGNKEGEANCYNDIGVIHYYAENYQNARDYFEMALGIYQQLRDTSGIAMYYNNVANTYFDEDELKQSLEMYQKGLEYDIIIGDLEGQCITMSNIGETYTALGEYDKAEKILLETLVIAEETDDPWSITNPLRGLGGLYQQTEEYHKAIRVLERNVKICNEIDAIPEQTENYELLYSIHKEIGNYESALHFFELHRNLNDSILDIEKERLMDEMEVKYQLKDKAKEIDLITQEKELDKLQHDQEMDSARNKLYMTILGLFAFAVVIFFALRSMIQKKKANDQLKAQNEIIQNKNEEIKSAYHQIEEKNNEILDSINYAKRIQSAILPPKNRIEELLPESFIMYRPKDVVAGDFYWLEEKNGKVLIAAADCTGHGVPGAMVSVVCNNGLNRSVREHEITEPAKILDRTREIVLDEFGKSEEKVNDGMDIALVSLDKQGDKTKLQYAGAHNPLWIIRSGSSEIEEIRADKQPIGAFRVQNSFTNHEVELDKGDTVYIFTDGYADQFGGEKGKKLKTVNFKKLLLLSSKRSMVEQKSRLENAFDEWKGQLEQLDDVCVIGLKV